MTNLLMLPRSHVHGHRTIQYRIVCTL